MLNKNEILQSNKININNILDKPGSNENLKPKNEILADNDNEEDNDEMMMKMMKMIQIYHLWQWKLKLKDLY